jgi:hypothetical protein
MGLSAMTPMTTFGPGLNVLSGVPVKKKKPTIEPAPVPTPEPAPAEPAPSAPAPATEAAKERSTRSITTKTRSAVRGGGVRVSRLQVRKRRRVGANGSQSLLGS